MSDLSEKKNSLKSKTIGVLMGGLSTEREVSLNTGRACSDALQSLGYRVVDIDVQKDVAQKIAEAGIDVAFIALHGRYGEDGCIQGLLESMMIPYTGSGVLASAMGMNKIVAKRIFEAQGIPTAKDTVLKLEDLKDFHGSKDLPFPLPVVVKPSGEGSSVGVSIAHTEEELSKAIDAAKGLKGDILVEQFVKGREIQAAVLDDEALGAIEIVPDSSFYDYRAKYEIHTNKYLFPAPIPADQYEKVCAIALAAHRALGCSGASRSDLLVREDGSMVILELNSLPGMTAASLLPKIAKGRGIEFPQLCERLLLGASLKG